MRRREFITLVGAAAAALQVKQLKRQMSLVWNKNRS